jgi:hypothetical protein
VQPEDAPLRIGAGFAFDGFEHDFSRYWWAQSAALTDQLAIARFRGTRQGDLQLLADLPEFAEPAHGAYAKFRAIPYSLGGKAFREASVGNKGQA